MTEAEIQRKIIKYSEASGFIIFRLNAGYSGRYNTRMAPPGTPDLLCIHRDGSLWVEVKQSGGKVSKAQEEMHSRLRALGQNVIVAWSLDDFIEAVK